MALALICVLTVLGFLGALHWTLDLASHFRLVYAPLLLVGTIYALLAKQRVLSGLLFVFAAANLAVFLPYVVSGTAESAHKNDAVAVKILQFNVWLRNRDTKRLAELILSEDADFVALEECSDPCRHELQGGNVAKLYPFFVENRRDSLLLLSKTPLTLLTKIHDRSPPLLLAESEVADRRIVLLVTHLTRPSERPVLFAAQVENLIRTVNELEISQSPFFLIGDLNMTPFSTHFSRLLSATGLKNSQNGFGLQPTFPAVIPRTRFRLVAPVIPIDHVLVSPEIHIHSRQNAPFAGSDHLPIAIETEL